MQQYPINLDNLAKHLQDNERRESDVTWWSIPRGTSSIRVLPPWDATGRIALQVYQHRIEHKDDSMSYTKYNWTCSERSFGVPCPICAALNEVKAAGVDVTDYESNRRVFYVNVMVMYDPDYENALKSGKKPDSGLPQGTIAVARVPKTVYDWVVTQITNPLIGDVTNLQTGIDLYVTKEGQGLGTSYSVTTSPNGRTAIPANFLDGKNLYDLSQIFSQGFDEKLLNGMINKLKNSAKYVSNMVPPTVPQQSPQYYQPQPQVPVAAPQYYQPQQQMPVPPTFPAPVQTAPTVPFNYPSQQMTPPAPPMPVQSTPPVVPQPAPPQMQIPQPPAPVAPQQMQMQIPLAPAPIAASVAPQDQTLQGAIESGRPKCFGNYNPSNVTCVVCPSETDCVKVAQPK